VRKVVLYSLLLVAGLVGSQFLSQDDPIRWPIRILTMVALSFIMINVGREFEIDKSRPRQYVWDYAIAGTAAAFPWIFCALYFVYVLAPPELWAHGDLWREALLEARFASPTSAGVLFSMLAAAGLASTWMFQKARVLAIFDDLDTILLMIPLKIMIVGFRWQLSIIVALIFLLLWLAWRHLHRVRLPVNAGFILVYAVLITAVSEGIHLGSIQIDAQVPIDLEVLLPAFALGCMLAHPHVSGRTEEEEKREEFHELREGRTASIVSACFMVLVGLSMPAVFGVLAEAAPVAESAYRAFAYEGVSPQILQQKNAPLGAGAIVLHVLIVTILSNFGKMFPTLCYRREASWRERLALSVSMFPRGEVGAGVLVVSIGYGLGGPALTVAVLSLALNLLLTGAFIIAVRRLLAGHEAARPKPELVAR